MDNKAASSRRNQERGQTMVLVAISLISLLAMAALAIDVVTLYVARSEIQRAADATALAAAKAIADSGYTTLPTNDPHYIDGTALALAQTMSNSAICAMLTANNPTVNQVAGMQPVLSGGSPPCGTPPTIFFPALANPPNSNPHITVTLQMTTLPTFFARIWGNRTAAVTASATAEAYNPANVQNFTPIAPKGVKPWLVANSDPSTSTLTPFITPATGAVEPGVIGETFNLTADCASFPNNSCALNHTPPQATYSATYPQVDYVPALVTANTNDVCPSPSSCTENPNYADYQYSVQCHDVNPYPCGGPVNNFTWDPTVNPGGSGGPSALGAECLIHASNAGLGQNQDTLTDPAPWPAGPFLITTGSGTPIPVTTSSSIATIPIIDNSAAHFHATGAVTIVGFMQAFINQVQSGASPGTTAGDINVTVLNIAACSSSTPTANPVLGSGTSPIPVRLITPP
jgi:Putative Flp pilus-assembly TadE/G-like